MSNAITVGDVTRIKRIVGHYKTAPTPPRYGPKDSRRAPDFDDPGKQKETTNLTNPTNQGRRDRRLPDSCDSQDSWFSSSVPPRGRRVAEFGLF
jgi:hypothetical protein